MRIHHRPQHIKHLKNIRTVGAARADTRSHNDTYRQSVTQYAHTKLFKGIIWSRKYPQTFYQSWATWKPICHIYMNHRLVPFGKRNEVQIKHWKITMKSIKFFQIRGIYIYIYIYKLQIKPNLQGNVFLSLFLIETKVTWHIYNWNMVELIEGYESSKIYLLCMLSIKQLVFYWQSCKSIYVCWWTSYLYRQLN